MNKKFLPRWLTFRYIDAILTHWYVSCIKICLSFCYWIMFQYDKAAQIVTNRFHEWAPSYHETEERDGVKTIHILNDKTYGWIAGTDASGNSFKKSISERIYTVKDGYFVDRQHAETFYGLLATQGTFKKVPLDRLDEVVLPKKEWTYIPEDTTLIQNAPDRHTATLVRPLPKKELDKKVIDSFDIPEDPEITKAKIAALKKAKTNILTKTKKRNIKLFYNPKAS